MEVSVSGDMDEKVLEKALDESGGDIDSMIKKLHGLCLQPSDNNNNSSVQEQDHTTVQVNSSDQWEELFVREMMSACSMDDARARASRVLEAFEKSVRDRAVADVATDERIRVLVRENSILKKAVTIQHKRQKKFDENKRELEGLKQVVNQYQEQLRALEMTNYALTMHLKRAQESCSFDLRRFPPNVF